MFKKIQYNSPVSLTFALASLGVLILGEISGGYLTRLLFCVYSSPLSDPLTYIRVFTHVLGHADYQHYISNMLLLLVLGPQLEERYGSKQLLWAIVVTAVVSGLLQLVLFSGTGLLGASGVVFMMISMASLGGMKKGGVPLTLIFVAVFYIGGEIAAGLSSPDNISQMAHIAGGVCGAVAGYYIRQGKGRRS